MSSGALIEILLSGIAAQRPAERAGRHEHDSVQPVTAQVQRAGLLREAEQLEDVRQAEGV